MKAFLRDTLTTLILAVVLYFGIRTTIQTYPVNGTSMMPSFIDKQRLVVNKTVYKFFHEPQRGDVIIFVAPNNPKEDYIKRVIGLPGESVEIKEGKVYILRKGATLLPLNEPYITEATKRDFKSDVIPKNEYFVLGDNRNNSGDSRQGWTVPRQKIIGKAWLSIWPQEKWGLATNYSFPE